MEALIAAFLIADIQEPLLGVIFAAIVSPIGAYILAARKMSGKIGTSDAEQLWEESRSIREWSTKRIEACDAEILDLRQSLRDARRRIADLEDQNDQLRREVEELKRERDSS